MNLESARELKQTVSARLLPQIENTPLPRDPRLAGLRVRWRGRPSHHRRLRSVWRRQDAVIGSPSGCRNVPLKKAAKSILSPGRPGARWICVM